MESWQGGKDQHLGRPMDVFRPTRQTTTPRGGSIITRVNELIDLITEQWDEELICSIFSPVDVGRLLRIH